MVPKPTGDEITLVDLATQHSGLPPILPQTAADDWQEYLARRGVGRPPHPPFLSSNFGFGLLGHLLAARAGLTYSELLKEQITGPLGLSDTVVSLSPGQQSQFIQGYEQVRAGLRPGVRPGVRRNASSGPPSSAE